MDSAQMFLLDSVYGPLEDAEMYRKNKNGTYYRNVVPYALTEYNDKMGGVDNINQERTGYYNDEIDHREKKWTIRYYEGLDGFATTNAYNLYKFNNRDKSKKDYFHFNFVLEIIQGMLTYYENPRYQQRPNTRGGAGASAANDENKHILMSLEERDNRNRRKRGSCHVCPNTDCNGNRNWKRETHWRCIQCDKFFHPECFNQYHSVTIGAHERLNGDNFTSPPNSTSGSGQWVRRSK
jgi:hypothetical protein